MSEASNGHAGRELIRWAPRAVLGVGAIGWTAVVVWLSVDPGLPPVLTEPTPFLQDAISKWGHFVSYALLAGAYLLWAWSLRGPVWRPVALPLAILASVSVFGGGLELVQSAVPGRVPSWLDVGMNAGGAAAGLLGLSAGRLMPFWHARALVH